MGLNLATLLKGLQFCAQAASNPGLDSNVRAQASASFGENVYCHHFWWLSIMVLVVDTYYISIHPFDKGDPCWFWWFDFNLNINECTFTSI